MIKSHTFLSDAVPLTLFHVHMYSDIANRSIWPDHHITISPSLPLFLVSLPLYSHPTDNYFICPFRSPDPYMTLLLSLFDFPVSFHYFPLPTFPPPTISHNFHSFSLPLPLSLYHILFPLLLSFVTLPLFLPHCPPPFSILSPSLFVLPSPSPRSNFLFSLLLSLSLLSFSSESFPLLYPVHSYPFPVLLFLSIFPLSFSFFLLTLSLVATSQCSLIAEQVSMLLVSCGGNLLMNVGPTSQGTIDPIFQERLRYCTVDKWVPPAREP